MNSTETATFDLPLPTRNFAWTGRVLLLVLAASVLIPLACLGVYAYYDFQRCYVDAEEPTERFSRVANEHALKVMDLNQQLEARIVDMLGDSDDAAISSRQENVASHARRYERHACAGGCHFRVRRRRRVTCQ